MIHFPLLGTRGRLGNQLFQYAALRGLCLKNGYETALLDLRKMSWHGQRCLLNEFNIVDSNPPSGLKYKYKEKTWRCVDSDFYNINDNTSITGFFQSIFYFKDNQEQIRAELTPRIDHLERAYDFINKMKYDHDCDIVSVHLRRGDNMTANNRHNYIPYYEDGGAYWEYFRKAKNVFERMRVKFLIFTGGGRGVEDNTADVEWCKSKFIGDEYLFSQGTQIEDFCRIMLCDHNILSHVSSFGWWAAYQNRKGIHVAPRYYHPNEPKLERYMFYPEDYILL